MADEDSTFSIRLMDKRQRPLSDRKITVFYSGMFSGWEDRYTGSDGWCEFPTFGRTWVKHIYSYMLFGFWAQKRSLVLAKDQKIFDGATLSFTIIDE